MAKKLVFDRTIWIPQKQAANIAVPKDETWKAGIARCDNTGEIFLSASYFNSAYSWDRVIAGGATVKMEEKSVLNGIAFKVVEE